MNGLPETQWWLATIHDGNGITTLTDGPHDSIEGVEQAAYLMRALGLQHGDRYAAAEVRLSEVAPKAHDVNHEAVSRLCSSADGLFGSLLIGFGT